MNTAGFVEWLASFGGENVVLVVFGGGEVSHLFAYAACEHGVVGAVVVDAGGYVNLKWPRDDGSGWLQGATGYVMSSGNCTMVAMKMAVGKGVTGCYGPPWS
ncbi:hypothetical protein H7J86_32495 [Mycobacterium hackensackense]|uniref:hypothetical protein n=1 Tax=Mycobacterium hackensackense TaxID=228909 RepID=UPI0022658948|nr:hypothetical protein [Mycobacterium hackensackense]MCV7256905.1 hypothetical protein [Mycobacterium hackensackense]